MRPTCPVSGPGAVCWVERGVRISTTLAGALQLLESKVVHTRSPGRGEHLSGKGQQRLQLVDPSAPPAEPKHAHFYRREGLRKYGRRGKLKRPVKTLFDPGADEGVIGYIDYTNMGDGYLKVALLVVRDDYRGKRVADKLLDALYSKKGVKGVHFGRVLNPTAWKVMQRAKKKYPDVETIGSKFF